MLFDFFKMVCYRQIASNVVIAIFIGILSSPGAFGRTKRDNVDKIPEISKPTIVHILSSSNLRHINPVFFGTNNLYWIDDDRAWDNKQFVRQLKGLGVQTLRYPGGTVANNYDWETNRLEHPEKFPFEAKSEKESDERLDYREFLKNAKAAGISSIFFVVNVEGAFLRPGNLDENIELYADKAARWVKAVHDAGYRVEHWEIGNEEYLNSAFALTAKEYAKALRVFYRKMKAADQTIKIGAVGPHALKGLDAVGFADKMGPEDLKKFRDMHLDGKEPCEKGDRKSCLKKLGISKVSQAKLPIWWDVVLNEAADSFNFVVIHRYRTSQVEGGKHYKTRHITLGEYIRGLKNHIEIVKGVPIQLALTEWNTPNKSRELSESAHALDIIEQIGNYLEGGVDYALYWPMRLPGQSYTLLSLKEFQPTTSYQALSLAHRYIGEQTLTTSGYDSDNMYIHSSGYKGGYKVLVVNKAINSRCLKFISDKVPVKIQSGEVFSDIELMSLPRKLLPNELHDSGKTVCIPGRAISGLSLNNQIN